MQFSIKNNHTFQETSAKTVTIFGPVQAAGM
jgi:hypothetical protein